MNQYGILIFPGYGRYAMPVDGKTITYMSPELAYYVEALRAKGASDMMLNIMTGMPTAMRNGDFTCREDHLAELLGRKPTALRKYLKSICI